MDYGSSLLDAVNCPAVERKDWDALPLRHPTQDNVTLFGKRQIFPEAPAVSVGGTVPAPSGFTFSHSKARPTHLE